MKKLIIEYGMLVLAIVIVGFLLFDSNSIKSKQGEIYKHQIDQYSQTP